MNIKNLFILFRNVQARSYEKGEVIIEQGSKDKSIFFMRKGLVRSFLVNNDDEEITFQLFAEHQAFGNFHSILLDETSKFTFEAIEPIKCLYIEYDAFQNLMIKNPELKGINISYMVKYSLKQAFKRIESFVFLTPEERYEKYVTENPQLINRAPDKYIANILGITPVSLSRIRGRIKHKKGKNYKQQ